MRAGHLLGIQPHMYKHKNHKHLHIVHVDGKNMAGHNFWILEFVKEFSRHVCHPASSWDKRHYKKSHNWTPPSETYYTVFIVFPHSFAFYPLFFKVNCDLFTKKERVTKNINCPSFI